MTMPTYEGYSGGNVHRSLARKPYYRPPSAAHIFRSTSPIQLNGGGWLRPKLLEPASRKREREVPLSFFAKYYSSRMTMPVYEGGFGGNVHRRQLMSSARTPYERPSSAAHVFRSTSTIPLNGGGRLPKFLEPASQKREREVPFPCFANYYSSRMTMPAYEGGSGGNVHRRQLRSPAKTPYDRPLSTAPVFRSTSPAQLNGDGWLRKFLEPASRFVTRTASRLFSFFPPKEKRLVGLQTPAMVPTLEEKEKQLVEPNKEQEDLIDIFSEERTRRDEEEASLRKRLKGLEWKEKTEKLELELEQCYRAQSRLSEQLVVEVAACRSLNAVVQQKESLIASLQNEMTQTREENSKLRESLDGKTEPLDLAVSANQSLKAQLEKVMLKLKEAEAESKNLIDRWMLEKTKDAEKLNETRDVSLVNGGNGLQGHMSSTNTTISNPITLHSPKKPYFHISAPEVPSDFDEADDET